MFEFRIDFPLKKIGLMLWINEIVYKNMLQMLEEEFFKMEMYVIIIMDCEILEFRLVLYRLSKRIVLIINSLLWEYI